MKLAAVDEPYRPLFEFAVQTGGRIAEVLGVVWGDLDLDALTVSFTHQLLRKGQRAKLKTKRSRRTLEITPALAATLRGHKLATPDAGARDLVFINRLGKGHDHRNIGGRVLARALERSGLVAGDDGGKVGGEENQPTFHSLRHTHASALIHAGWDIEEVSARLGHRDAAFTLRIYVHEYEAARHSQDRRNRLTQLYGSANDTVDGDRQKETGEATDTGGDHVEG